MNELEQAKTEIEFLRKRLAFVKKHVAPRHKCAYFISDEDHEFFNQLFTNLNNGRAAAIVVMLMIAILPVMIYQVRHIRAEEAAR